MLPVTPGTLGAAQTGTGEAVDVLRKVGPKKVWDKAYSSLGFGSDHENTPQWLRQKRSKAYWQDNQTDIYDAYRLNEETSIGNEEAIMRRLRKAGLIDDAGNVLAPEGYDPASFDPTSDAALDPNNRRRLRRGLESKHTRTSQYINSFNEARAELAKKKMDTFKSNTIDPLTKTITERLNEMLSNPTISPEELQDMKGEMVSQARAQEAQRLKRVGATLGIRGIDPGDIAGAALISRIGEETDAQITEGLRKFGLDIAQMENDANASELGMSTSLATQLSQLETALTSGNLEQVFSIGNNLASIYEAIAAQDKTLDVQKDANRLGFYSSMANAATNMMPI